MRAPHGEGVGSAHVPYKVSAGAVADLLGGQVPVMFSFGPT